MRLKTYLFDMGNVLVHFCHDRMCQQMGNLCQRTGSAVRQLMIESGLQWEFERGSVTPSEYHQLFQQVTGCKVDRAELLHANCDIFTLNSSLMPVIDELKRRGHRLVLLSNTSAAHFQFIWSNFEVLQKFDEHILSYKVKALKPEAGMYVAALGAVHCAPEECFYTDDIADYVAAGRRFGFDAEVFTTTEQFLQQQSQRQICFPRHLLTPRRASA